MHLMKIMTLILSRIGGQKVCRYFFLEFPEDMYQVLNDSYQFIFLAGIRDQTNLLLECHKLSEPELYYLTAMTPKGLEH